MSVHEQTVADLNWMLRELGEEIVYHQKIENIDLNFFAIVDRNAESPPPYGYEHSLSQKHHEFTFLRNEVLAPKRGDQIVLQGVTYEINYIHPNDDVVWTVAAR